MEWREHFRGHWEALKHGAPGRRFIDRYEAARRDKGRGGIALRVGSILVAVVFLAVALVLSVIPGPAFPFFILAGVLLASESRAIARVMDWLEVRVRRICRWALGWWRGASLAVRVSVVAVVVAGGAAALYLGYRWLSA